MSQVTPNYTTGYFLPGKSGYTCKEPTKRLRRGSFESHIKAIRNYCNSQAVIYDNTNHIGGTIHKHGNACNSWDCEPCRKKKASVLRSRIDSGINGQNWKLLTLTIDPKRTTLPESLNTLSHLWDQFSKRLRRRFKDLKYIRVVEFNKSGYPHLHLIIDQYIYKPWIIANWSDLGGGTIVDIQQIKGKNVGRYVSGYLSHKEKKHHEHDHQFYDYGLRRFNFSRNFPIKPWEKRTVVFCNGIDWDAAGDRFDSVIENCYKSGIIYAVTNSDKIKYINLHSNGFDIRKV